MPGLVKRKYEAELVEIKQKIYREIKRMLVVLPPNFTLKDVVCKYQEYYPFQHLWWKDMNNTYIRKNKILVNVGKKKRYKEFCSFEEFLLCIPGIKLLLNKSQKGELFIYTEEEKQKFISKRDNKIKEKERKIEEYKLSLCNGNMPFEVDPLCLEKMTKEYLTGDDKEKIQILDYLFKYLGDSTITLLQTIYEKEKNDFITDKIFNHLQKLNRYVRLSKKRKDSSRFEYDPQEETLDDLHLDIKQHNSFERKKQFHFFISHNINDKSCAQEMVNLINSKGYDCYFCWISDDKDGTSEHLGEVLELRIKQSRAVIKIDSENHRNSDWCLYEIEKSLEYHKQVYTYVIGEDIEQFVDETIRSFKSKQQPT